MPSHSVLLVEDDEDLGELLRELFLQAGWDVQLEHNGAQALRALQQVRPDIVVTDCMMPEMGGIELLERLRSVPELASLPVVLMSGADSILEGASVPRHATVRKPFDPQKLIDLVNEVLSH